MPTKPAPLPLLPLIALSLACASCRRAAPVSALEAHESAGVAMLAADEAQRKGDYAAAYALFDAVALEARPVNALAHLRAAIVAQDALGDDASAAYHLRAYVRLRPDADKSAMAAERLALARRRLSGATPAADELGEEIRRKDALAAALIAERSNLVARIAAVEDENALLRSSVASLRKYQEMLDLVGAPTPGGLTPDIVRQGADPAEEPPPSDLPKPLTYEVRPGDTLWSIAQEVYLDGSRAAEIRSANPGKIAPDGSVRSGVILTIPR